MAARGAPIAYGLSRTRDDRRCPGGWPSWLRGWSSMRLERGGHPGNADARYVQAFRARMATPPDPVSAAYERWWEDKRTVLRRVRARAHRDLDVPWDPTEGRVFAPLVDLACHRKPGYDWMPAGLIGAVSDTTHRLARGTAMVFDHGEQEWCPGGPGENLLG